MVITYRGSRRARGRWSRGRRLRSLAFAVSLCVLVASMILMAVLGRRLLVLATTEPIEEGSATPLLVAAAAFMASAVVLVVLQAARIAKRAAGPERRLIQAIRRVRAGDVGFRVHLRSGDLLVDLADEFNALLDWLNVNPPEGVVTGSDVVDVEEMEQVHSIDLAPGIVEPAMAAEVLEP